MDDLSSEYRERLEREKLAALYQFAYGLSHEINNPLTNISARAQSLLATEKDPARRRTLATIHTQAMKAYEMIADLMLFARPPTPNKKRVNLVEVANQVVREWAPQAEAQGTELTLAASAASLPLDADPDQLAIAIAALLRNSLEAIRSGGRITLSACINSDAEPCLAIADTGPGITPEVRRHLFDPYYSGREAGRGLGLGLSKAWRTIELHGGRIEVESPESGGAVFKLAFPQAQVAIP